MSRLNSTLAGHKNRKLIDAAVNSCQQKNPHKNPQRFSRDKKPYGLRSPARWPVHAFSRVCLGPNRSGGANHVILLILVFIAPPPEQSP